MNLPADDVIAIDIRNDKQMSQKDIIKLVKKANAQALSLLSCRNQEKVSNLEKLMYSG